jgi:hypothetical protein
LLAGFRYTYLGQHLGLQTNNREIDTASTQLVDQFAQQLTTPNVNLQALIQQNILRQLRALDGHKPAIAGGPIR